jgi:hypothetical protein
MKKGASLDVAVNTRDRSKRTLKQRFAEFIRATFFIPDARIGWYRNAVKEGMKIINEYPISVIYSSSPPYTVSLVARKLARKSGISWVAGFRDPWTGFESSTPDRWFLPAAIDRKLEHSVFRDASFVDIAWKGIMLDVRGKYPEVPESKFIHIPNGFDSNDFPEPDITKRAERQRGAKFTITHSGSLYGPRNPNTFLKAIKLLVARNEIDKEKVLLRFVGRSGPEIDEMLADPQVSPMIEKISYVAHTEAVRLVSDSDALLLIVDETETTKHIVPGKVYEYLGAMRPLIALAPPEGAIGDLLRETSGGEIVRQSDIEAIANAILSYYRKWISGENLGASMNVEAIRQYERREATRKLASLFDRLVTSNE